jgi:hypothetical protein
MQSSVMIIVAKGLQVSKGIGVTTVFINNLHSFSLNKVGCKDTALVV